MWNFRQLSLLLFFDVICREERVAHTALSLLLGGYQQKRPSDPLFIKILKVNSTDEVSTRYREYWNSQAFKDGLGVALEVKFGVLALPWIILDEILAESFLPGPASVCSPLPGSPTAPLL